VILGVLKRGFEPASITTILVLVMAGLVMLLARRQRLARWWLGSVCVFYWVLSCPAGVGLLARTLQVRRFGAQIDRQVASAENSKITKHFVFKLCVAFGIFGSTQDARTLFNVDNDTRENIAGHARCYRWRFRAGLSHLPTGSF